MWILNLLGSSGIGSEGIQSSPKDDSRCQTQTCALDISLQKPAKAFILEINTKFQKDLSVFIVSFEKC